MTIPNPFPTNRAEAAKFYRDKLGWAAHPLYGPNKGRPTERGKCPEFKGWKQWTADKLTDEIIEKYLGNFGVCNLGCVIRSPQIGVDLDSKPDGGKSVMEWLAAQPHLAAVPRERSAGGVHLHFICHDLPVFKNKNGDIYKKQLVAQITEAVSAELLFNGNNMVLSPSQHYSGHIYTWEVFGDIPEVTWAELQEWFGFEAPDTKKQKSVGKIKAAQEAPWWTEFKGDLRTLNVLQLFREADRLGTCLNPDEDKWSVRCPWSDEHSDGGKDWSAKSTETAIFNSPDRVPGFKCMHAHCADRDIAAVLKGFDEQNPGCVDAACAQMRVWETGQANQDGRPRLVLPGLGRPESIFASEAGEFLSGDYEWFNKNDTVVTVGLKQFSETVICLAFKPMLPVAAVTSIEEHIETGILQKDKESGDIEFKALTMGRELAGSLLSSPQFKRKLPQIIRILDLPMPIRRPDGSIEFPKSGYDPRFKTYCDPEHPKIRPMPVAEAKEVLLRIHQGFCFRDPQSITHALARIITPYCRGLMGWQARFPLWIFIGNRPRVGKDYLAGVTALVYEGSTSEDAPLERESEETRKRITAALMAGRRFIHFANCQGHIDDAVFIGSITSHIFAARNLGSTEAKADLRLPNELEFSISANVGLTFREDVEPRSRKITLYFDKENPNDRDFPIKYLHDYVLKNRGEILSAVASLVGAWIDAGCPEGTTPFTSFPQWAATVGGILQFHGWGDPCLPHIENDDEVGGDRLERAMRALYRTCYQQHPENWIEKSVLFQVIAQAEDDDDLGFFGNFGESETRKTKTRIGIMLRKFNGRELGGIRMELEGGSIKTINQKVRFSKSGGSDPVPAQLVWADFAGFRTTPQNPDTSGTSQNAQNGKVSCVSPCSINTETHLGHVEQVAYSAKAQQFENIIIHVEEINNNKKSSTKKVMAEVLEVCKVSAPLPPPTRVHQLLTSREKLADIASLLANEACIALDIETYGQGKGDGLDPWKGDIRLLQLAGDRTSIFILDLMALGYDLGPLAAMLCEKEIIAHSAKFDLLWLAVKCGIRPKSVFCTLTAARLLSAGTKPGNDLDKCLERYLGIPAASDQSRSDWGGMILTHEQIAYAARDVAHLHTLRACLQYELEMSGLDEVFAMESKLLPHIIAMEEAGFCVDADRLRQIEQSRNEKAAELAASVRQIFGLPELALDSPKQLLVALQNRGLNLNSTNEETLQSCGDTSVVPQILQYRGLKKQAEQAASLLEHIASDGRIHGSFEPTGTDTGRFSSKRPNLQNIGRGELRSCFIAAPGHRLVVADYSQIELRAAAVIAGEPKMIEAYKRGDDLHKITASTVLGKPLEEVTKDDRQLAKSCNFGLLYGQSAKGLVRYAASSYGVTLAESEAHQIRDAFFRTYTRLRQWHNQSRTKAEQGITEVRTLMGRRRLIPETAGDWESFTALVNTPVQGTCADGLKQAIIKLANRLPSGTRILSTVHDELIVEAPECDAQAVCELVRSTMIEAMAAMLPDVPIEVEGGVCSNWSEK